VGVPVTVHLANTTAAGPTQLVFQIRAARHAVRRR
jgi:hypothetical protein